MKYLLTFLLFTTLAMAQSVVMGPEDWLKWDHNNDYINGENAPIQRFDVKVTFLGVVDAIPVIAFQSMVAPDDVGLKTYSVKVINIFRDILDRGEFEVTLIAYDLYGFKSDPSTPLLVTWSPSNPTPPFNVRVEVTP